jgi:hypothetical protein
VPLAAVALAAALALAGPAAAQDLKRPASLTKPPPGHTLSAKRATLIAGRDGKVRQQRARHRALFPVAYQKGPRRWQVSWFGDGRERAQVLVDDRSGRVLESWTGHQVAWRMARGYSGQFGHRLNAPYVWLPLCVLFVLPFVDPRRPLRLLHLDLLVLLAFGASHWFFNRGEIGVSVPLAYPVLAYLLVRMLVAGLRGRERPERPLPVLPVVWVALALVFLVGFRIALNATDSRVIDVGYSGVIGADRIAHGDELYGERFAKDNEHGDTYGPVSYLVYVPFEAALPWSGRWDDLPAGHAAAVAFDLLTLLGLLVLGVRLRDGPEGWALGVALAYGWAAYPYTTFVLQSNSNDALVAMLLVWAFVALRSPPARGALLALAAAAKFAPAALIPLLAREPRPRAMRRSRLTGRATSPRTIAAYAAAAAAVAAATFLPFLPDGGPRELYDRTVGNQLGRDSPFSVWGQEPSLATLHTILKAAAVGLALALALVPRRRTPAQLAALAAAVLIAVQLTVTHWFYLYVVWFLPLVLLALLAPLRGAAGPAGSAGPVVGEAPAPRLELDPRGRDHLRDQPVPAGAHDQLE